MFFDLTGVWDANDGGRYYIRQIGRRVYWMGLSGGGDGASFSNVFVGTANFRTNTVRGRWADVPRGLASSSGFLTLGVTSNTQFVKLSGTGGFGGSVWRFVKTQGKSLKAPKTAKRVVRRSK